MRKAIFGRQLSRGRGARTALFRSLVRNLIMRGSINTTKAKAKAVQADIDKLITLAKKDSLAAKRGILAKLGNDKQAYDLLFSTVIPSVQNRNSGYTRILQLPARKGDAAKMVILEFVDKLVKPEQPKVKKAEQKTKAAKKSGKRQVKSEK